MESARNTKNNFLKVSHFPTLMLLIGYPVYWLELFFFNRHNGITSLSGWFLFLSAAAIVVRRGRLSFVSLQAEVKTECGKSAFFDKIFTLLTAFIFVGIITIALYASVLPPHLPQEFDALNYHITVPRQHLVIGSFGHIPWSAADLFLMPIDFALAPYWLATELPNKFPQFLFLIGLILIAINLLRRSSSSSFYGILLTISAILGSHFIGIQVGTAMLDISIAYLFLAAIDSFLDSNIFIFSIEFLFFFWSKPFIPLQCSLLFVAMSLAFIAFKIFGFKELALFFVPRIGSPKLQEYSSNIKKSIIPFVLLSALIAGPFLAKSIYYAGTPLYPFVVGILNKNFSGHESEVFRNSLVVASKTHMTTKDAYGYGRSGADFFKHFWLISVPDKGVNNRYDYPVGLIYLIFFGPFLYMFFLALKKKVFALFPLSTVFYWVCWWFGSQQTRFLYIPVLLMIIAVMSEMKTYSKIFMGVVAFSLIITAGSILRAHRNDFFVHPENVLRPKDKGLVELGRSYLKEGRSDVISLNFYDVAYARFPVMVREGEVGWVLKTN